MVAPETIGSVRAIGSGDALGSDDAFAEAVGCTDGDVSGVSDATDGDAVAEGTAETSGEGTAETSAEAVGVGVTGTAVGVGAGRGPGANATIPPRTSSAVAIPARSPATIERRDLISRESTSTRAAGAHAEGPRYDAASMDGLPDRIRTRLLPALLTAAGVTMLAAGLLTYTTPVDAGPGVTSRPSATPGAQASPSLRTLPPVASAPPSAAPSIDPDRVATRIRIAALDIDLPIVAGPAGYPYCNVAMYLKELHQPGQGKATYIFAHAREGMFLPLLRTSGKHLKGMLVEVWTSDDYRFLYEISEVRRDQRTLADALAATTEQLWLQTSEGPRGTPGKTQVIATPLSVETADDADAHPTPKPVDCA